MTRVHEATRPRPLTIASHQSTTFVTRDGAGLFRSALHALVTPDTAWVFVAPSAMAPFLLFLPLSRQHGAGGR